MLAEYDEVELAVASADVFDRMFRLVTIVHDSECVCVPNLLFFLSCNRNVQTTKCIAACVVFVAFSISRWFGLR